MQLKTSANNMFRFTIRKDEFLRIKLFWLIKLRWIIFFTASFFLIFQKIFLSSSSLGDSSKILFVTIVVGLCNAIFHFLHVYFKSDNSVINRNRAIFFFAQVIIDYACVTILISQYGFLPINLGVLYLPHIIISSIIFEEKKPGFFVLASSLFLIYWQLIIQEEKIQESFLASDLPRFYVNGSLALGLFSSMIFLFVFYLVSLLISFLIQRRKELQEKNIQLMQMEKEKQRYTLRATHELKAPFSAIQSYINVIQEGYLGDVNSKMMDVLNKIDSRCSSLSKMIQHIIQLSNLKTSRFDMDQFTDLDLIEFMKEKISLFESRAKVKNITIDFIHPKNYNVIVKCAHNLLDILFDNLIANALNYSHDFTSIKIIVSPPIGSEGVSIIVSDQGVGISLENTSKIFQEHFRTNEAAQINPLGNGMGLPIVQEIVRVHNGKIEVESELGKGSSFIIKLPLNLNT